MYCLYIQVNSYARWFETKIVIYAKVNLIRKKYKCIIFVMGTGINKKIFKKKVVSLKQEWVQHLGNQVSFYLI